MYNSLLEHVATYQRGLAADTQSEVDVTKDGDDVYYQFAGAALCDMLKLRYKQIKTCPTDCKDMVSHEITVLQAVNMKDKSTNLLYLDTCNMYSDKGYMYLPHYHFIPFFQKVDHVVKSMLKRGWHQLWMSTCKHLCFLFTQN